MTNTAQVFEALTTDHLMFTLEPGNASRTKFAIEMMHKINSLDVSSLNPEQVKTLEAIRSEVSEFLL